MTDHRAPPECSRVVDDHRAGVGEFALDAGCLSPTTAADRRCARGPSGIKLGSSKLLVALPLVLFALWVTASGCNSGRSPQKAANSPNIKHQTSSAGEASEALWVARPDAPFVKQVGEGANGSWLLLAETQRIELTAAGRLHVAQQWLSKPDVSVRALAPRLGGGFLFQRRSDETILHRAESYLAPLESIARLDLTSSEIIEGFDRLYAVLAQSHGVVPLDPRGGGAIDPGSLPAAPAYGPLAFANERFGVVTVPFRGALATFDAGHSWHPMGLTAVRAARVVDEGIALDTLEGTTLLTPQGIRETVAAESIRNSGDDTELDDNNLAQNRRAPRFPAPEDEEESELLRISHRLGQRLARAALDGWPMGGHRALLVEDGALLLVDLETSEVLAFRDHVAPVGASCHAALVFGALSFVCHTSEGTVVYGVMDAPLDLHESARFDGARRFAPGGRGAALVQGNCPNEASTRSRSFCVLPPNRAPWPLSLEHYDSTALVVALSDGRAAILEPPRRKHPGALTLVDASGTTTQRALAVAEQRNLRESMPFVESGLWVDSFVEADDGNLSGWVAGPSELRGLLIHPDGSFELGMPKGSSANTLLAGERALVIDDNQQGWQTLDGGMNWRALALPTAELALDTHLPRGLAARGCGAVGCTLGGWVRLGWLLPKKPGELPTAHEPAEAVLPPAGGARWVLDCFPERRVSPGRDSAKESADWPAFENLKAPNKPAGHQGYSQGLQADFIRMRGYVWGPAGRTWRQDGRWRISALSDYDDSAEAWSSSSTICPWADEQGGAEAFGAERRLGPAARWSASFDPDGTGGLLRIGTKTDSELYLVEIRRPLIRIQRHTNNPTEAIVGVANLQDAWYFATRESTQAVKLNRIYGGRIDATHTMFDVVADAHATLVRDVDGTALGIWVRDSRTRGAAVRWFVYPIDWRQGVAGEPLVISDDQLGSVPRPCTDDDRGWLLEGPLPLTPELDLGDAATSRPRSVRARLVASESGLCIEGMTATLEERVNVTWPRAAKENSARSTPIRLVLGQQSDALNRWVFECLR